MVPEPRPYVEMRNGGYYVHGKRMSLDTIVAMHNDGARPEEVQDRLPYLALHEVYGAIAFYLEHREVVDQNIREGDDLIRRTARPLSEVIPNYEERLKELRERRAASVDQVPG